MIKFISILSFTNFIKLLTDSKKFFDKPIVKSLVKKQTVKQFL